LPAESYIVETRTTAEVEPRERADFWSEHVGPYQARMNYRYARTDDFHGATVRQRTERYQLVKFWSDEVAYSRTARQVRQDPDED
jgi:hypothetical protein